MICFYFPESLSHVLANSKLRRLKPIKLFCIHIHNFPLQKNDVWYEGSHHRISLYVAYQKNVNDTPIEDMIDFFILGANGATSSRKGKTLKKVSKNGTKSSSIGLPEKNISFLPRSLTCVSCNHIPHTVTPTI